MKGKNRCRILKDIRKRIAEENGIEFATSECKYKGDCLGTCPKCEAEVRYLESELERRRSLGYKVSLVGLAAGISLASAGCTDFFKKIGGEELQGDMPSYSEASVEETVAMGEYIFDESSEAVSEYITKGQVPAEYSEDSDTVGEASGDESEYILDGDIDTEYTEDTLMGDMPAYDE